MFLLGKSKRDGLLYIPLVLHYVRLELFLVHGYFNPVTANTLVYAGIVALGTLAWLACLADAYRHSLRRQAQLRRKHTAISFLCLVAGCALVPVAYFFSDTRWVSLYATFLFLGWITAIILGKTFKTLPFIIWSSHYRHLNGKVKVPLPKQLYSERLTVYQFYLYVAAFVTLVAGMVMDYTPVIRIDRKSVV